MGEAVVTVLRGYPPQGSHTQAQAQLPRATRHPRLAERPAIVLHAAAEAATMPERFGIGAALVVLGRSVLDGCVFVGDELAEVSPGSLARLRQWAERHPLATTTGPRPWHVATSSEFFDPFARVEKEPAKPWAFQPTAYEGGGFVVGTDLGRSFGLVAEHVVMPRGRRSGAWQVWLPGWGALGRSSSVRRRSPHRPCLFLRARRVGWQVSWGPCGTDRSGKPAGKRDRAGRPFEGLFVDMLSLAYALDADRGASFAEHCEDFAMEEADLPVAATVDERGAESVTNAVRALHRLALSLDKEAASWFPGKGCASRVAIARTTSPGAIANELLGTCGIVPPLVKFDLGQEELEHWAEASHGGWCEADPRFSRVAVPAVTADVTSAYPLVAYWLGWWEALRAERLMRQSVTVSLRQACRRALSDPTVALDPATWRQFGLTLAEVAPDGERLPHAFEDPHHADDRLEVVGVRSPGRTLWYPWADVLAASVLSGRVPEIVRAVRLAPTGAQARGRGRRRLPLLPGLVLDLDRDPVLAIVAHRRQAKDRGDYRLAAELRVVVNALVYGGFCRFDDVSVREGRRVVLSERPGPWSCVPIAASVAAGARLLLALAERLVSDLGGSVVYRDTDSVLVLASPEGASFDMPGAGPVRALSWPEVDAVLAPFDRLSPEKGWEVWKQDRGEPTAPLRAVVFANKRHAEWTGDGLLLGEEGDEEAELVDATEASLGGTYADPPTLQGRVAPVNGYRRWSMAAVRREVDHAQALARSPDALRPPPAWDEGQEAPAPALRRLTVKTPAMAQALPACLGARPGTRYLEAQVANEGQREVVPVAPDPGGDLASWQGLAWVDRRTGQRVSPTTGPAGCDKVMVSTLDEKAVAWSRPSRRAVVTEVVVDPRKVRVKGRVSPVLDAVSDEGTGTDAAKRRPVYRPASCGCGCGTPLPAGRPDRRFVSDTHRKRAARASQRLAG